MNTRDQIRQLLEQEERERLAAGAAAGNKVEDHQPAEYRVPTKYGTTGWAMGCTCGQNAGKPSERMSMMHVWFARHVKKLGLPRFNRCDGRPYKSPVYMVGPAKGLTWDQAHAQGINING